MVHNALGFDSPVAPLVGQSFLITCWSKIDTDQRLNLCNPVAGRADVGQSLLGTWIVDWLTQVC